MKVRFTGYIYPQTTNKNSNLFHMLSTETSFYFKEVTYRWYWGNFGNPTIWPDGGGVTDYNIDAPINYFEKIRCKLTFNIHQKFTETICISYQRLHESS